MARQDPPGDELGGADHEDVTHALRGWQVCHHADVDEVAVLGLADLEDPEGFPPATSRTRMATWNLAERYRRISRARPAARGERRSMPWVMRGSPT
jgi:hypothetical protein